MKAGKEFDLSGLSEDSKKKIADTKGLKYEKSNPYKKYSKPWWQRLMDIKAEEDQKYLSDQIYYKRILSIDQDDPVNVVIYFDDGSSLSIHQAEEYIPVIPELCDEVNAHNYRECMDKLDVFNAWRERNDVIRRKNEAKRKMKIESFVRQEALKSSKKNAPIGQLLRNEEYSRARKSSYYTSFKPERIGISIDKR